MVAPKKENAVKKDRILNEHKGRNEQAISLTCPNRRQFLGRMGGITAATIAAGAIGLEPFGEKSARAATIGPLSNQRRNQAERIRKNMATANKQETPASLAHPTNGDEEAYPNRIASYTKGLPHDSNGEVDLNAYDAMLLAIANGQGNAALFDRIPLGGDRKLVNPQAGLAFEMEGRDSHSFVQPPPPAFASREEGAEIAENYWMALLRDTPFHRYGDNPIAAAAAADLTAFGTDFKGAKTGPDNDGVVTPELLFRGLTPGDKTGPFLSQFFYLPCFFGANEIDQKIVTARSVADGGADYMTDFAIWLEVQRGVSQPDDILDPARRYMRTGRDIGQWVHVDVLFQAYFHALLILLRLNAPFDPGNPYVGNSTQDGFGTFGGPHIATLMCEVSTRALHAVWYQKWFVHRRLRPEVFAARIDRKLYAGANYPIDSEILDSINTSSRLGGYLMSGNALLPMAFPEGSPLHPAYGAGHATVAGACTTILKAWFDESFIIPDPVQPSDDGLSLLPYAGAPLTVGGELNKIASNVALGRNIAGVHWRSDGTESLKLGEAVAIGVLREQRATFNEDFPGFSLTRFDGARVAV
jgi:hypothetical protein